MRERIITKMIELFSNIPPGLILILVATPIAFVPHHYRQFSYLGL